MNKLILLILLMAVSCNIHAIKPSKLLPPDEAFQFSAAPLQNGSIRLNWNIADGYYLYRQRFSFSSGSDGLTLNTEAAKYPSGDIKNDPNFGEMEVYHNQVVIDIPVNRDNTPSATELVIHTKYQGCADAGLCYSPQKKTATLQLAALPKIKTLTTTPKIVNGITRIANLNNTPLPADEAFQFTLSASDKKTLQASWQIAPEHHLYRSKIKFNIISPETVHVGGIEFPSGKTVNDDFFGEMEIYDDVLNLSIPLENTANVDEIIVETEYQGCSTATGICYQPTKKQNTLGLASLPDAAENGENSLTAQFFSGSFLGTLLAFFIVGLGLSLTPCIFPMIPILSGIIAGQENLSAYKAFLLSLAYVVASASAYALIGLVFGFFGENLQSSLQHPIAISLFAALFVVLALSMFGFFELQMPNSIQSRLNEISNKQRSGSLLGAAIMGFLSTLIVGPCVAPALAAALTYIADSKDALLGGSALFSMGLGMGVVLLIVGTLGGHLLPRAGAWMDTTKAIFGIMLLGMAIWMLNRIVPIGVTMLLSGILLVASGIYMGALDKLSEEVSGWGRFWKSIGLILLFFGTTQLLGVATGSQNILQPLKGLFTIYTTSDQTTAEPPHLGLKFQRITSVSDLKQILSQAKQSQQTVMLDFYANWCITCKQMEMEAFMSPTVNSILSNTILLQADITDNNATNQELLKYFGVVGPPTIIFFDKNSKEIKNLRMIGYENTAAFTQRVNTFQQHF